MLKTDERIDDKISTDYRRNVILSILVLVLLMTPATVIHEVGHSIVCSTEGHNGDIQIGVFTAYHICNSGDNDTSLFYRAFGGLFAMLVFLLPLVYKKSRSRTWRFVPLLSIALGHGLNAMFEAFFYEEYINGNDVISVLMQIIPLTLFIVLVLKYSRVR